jgi:hypothetical protein
VSQDLAAQDNVAKPANIAKVVACYPAGALAGAPPDRRSGRVGNPAMTWIDTASREGGADHRPPGGQRSRRLRPAYLQDRPAVAAVRAKLDGCSFADAVPTVDGKPHRNHGSYPQDNDDSQNGEALGEREQRILQQRLPDDCTDWHHEVQQQIGQDTEGFFEHGDD